MAAGFSFSGMVARFLVALILVFASFNPSGYSYFHWVMNRGDSSLPLLVLAGVALLIGWVIFLRATMRSLGVLGIVLAAALFGCLVWLAVDFNLLDVASQLFIYIVLIVFAAVLGVGMSWSHIRRRLSGQADMDDVDQ
jgi:Na+/melibiose symporter-like transporter